MLEGKPIICFDCETLLSASDCAICEQIEEAHTDTNHPYTAIGWHDKQRLSLSIGCAFDYATMQYSFFDLHTLESTVQGWVARQPLMVSFNGLLFDGPLLRAILRNRSEVLHPLCDAFKDLMRRGYDVLNAVWQADPARKFEKGLNSLDALSQANGYGAKEMDGATAPRLWAQGRYAEVIAYNVGDVLKTRKLFEQLVATGTLLRGDGQPLTLARPILPGAGRPAAQEEA